MENKTMMQYFEWYLPKNSLLWKRCAEQAENLRNAGINMVWLPPAYKGAKGNKSVGYDVYDTYDLGEFVRRDSTATKYGTKEEYLNAVKAFQSAGVEVLADIVLNHMMGADELEVVTAVEDNPENRDEEIEGEKEITVWTKFTFPNRGGKYSDFTWNYTHFSGADWDESKKCSGIYRFKGKRWNVETDSEFGNFDYLMGADLDFDNPETVKAVTDWAKWYYDTAKMDGFRLDAVKHISFEFYRDWIKTLREYTGKELFTVGEYWSSEIDKLTHYLDVVENSISLFDVPLHFAFYDAANSCGRYDMGSLMENTLSKIRPEQAVTFVDNHDTQPGQSLFSFIPMWFKPIAYAVILLQKNGVPCVFYGDYYGIPHNKIPPVPGLKTMIYIRKMYAYGDQISYFDDCNVVGFTRTGDEEHINSGLAVLMTDSCAGSKRMQVGDKFADTLFYNVLNPDGDPVLIDGEGFGEFTVDGGSVSVWVNKEASSDVWLAER